MLAIDHQALHSDGPVRVPTPWPEAWYEGGSELGLERFAGRVMAACFSHYEGSATGDARTGDCPRDDDKRPGTTADAVASLAGTAGNSTLQHSSAHPSKRSRGEEGDGGDEDSPPPKRRDTMGPPDRDATERKFYACPYQKRWPRESPFCGMPHGAKRDFGWESVSRVK